MTMPREGGSGLHQYVQESLGGGIEIGKVPETLRPSV